MASVEELLPPTAGARLSTTLTTTKRRLALAFTAHRLERLVRAPDEVEGVADDLRLRQFVAHGLPIGVVGIDRDRRDRLPLQLGERG